MAHFALVNAANWRPLDDSKLIEIRQHGLADKNLIHGRFLSLSIGGLTAGAYLDGGAFLL